MLGGTLHHARRCYYYYYATTELAVLLSCCSRVARLYKRGCSTTRALAATTLSSSSSSCTSPILQIHESVLQAQADGRPIVALESTILAHGMPFPQNAQLAQELATILRAKGVEPATIAIKNGVCRIGLSVDEIHDLCSNNKTSTHNGRVVEKCSTRELSLIMAKHQHQHGQKSGNLGDDSWGATTVASTMVLAHAAGIPTFVTGGIGGVHRHHSSSSSSSSGDHHFNMDISADLTELARTPVIVVSAGIKSILDIPRTLEVLETNGVPTVAYGTNEFPAFFSPHSGVRAPARLDSAMEIALAYWAARDLSLSHGMLVAVPNHDPASGGQVVEDAVQLALQQADESGIRGAAVTPFVLKRVAELTQGESLRSNVSLVKHNAAVGADIAIAIADLKRSKQSSSVFSGQVPFGVSATKKGNPDHDTTTIAAQLPKSRVVVMGGIVMDLVAKPLAGRGPLLTKTSNPATCTESDGGVGRNVAEVLGRLGSRPVLYSAVGNDLRGQVILNRLATECGVQTSQSTVHIVDGANTATYLAVLEANGDLHTACADMSVLSSIAPPHDIVLEAAEILVVDTNPPLHVLSDALRRAHRLGVHVFLEPTSVPKAMEFARHEQGRLLSCVTFASPNVEELLALADGWSSSPEDVLLLMEEHGFPTIRSIASRLLERLNRHETAANSAAHLLITMGAKGVLLASKRPVPHSRTRPFTLSFEYFPAPKNVKVENATGAGDTLAGAFIHSILQENNGNTKKDIDQRAMAKAVKEGMNAALLTLQCSHRTISPNVAGGNQD
jgi:pseudouridine-5'-phosphate glycosidase/sugar/nucleoside kinase (ribokinase family)